MGKNWKGRSQRRFWTDRMENLQPWNDSSLQAMLFNKDHQTLGEKQPRANSTSATSRKNKLQRCSVCGGLGHKSRTCDMAPRQLSGADIDARSGLGDSASGLDDSASP